MPTSTSSSSRSAWWRAQPTRVGAWFFGLAAVCTVVSEATELGWCQDERYAVVRELLHAPADADVVFLGSSRVARGLVPAAFDERVGERTGLALRSLNLGIFGLPREIGVLTLEAWLAEHAAPRLVLVEVGLLDVAEWPHRNLRCFLDPLAAAELVRDRPFDYESQAQFGAFRKSGHGRLDPVRRAGFHVRVATEALGRGPGDVLSAAYALVRNVATGRRPSPYRIVGTDVEPPAVFEAAERAGLHVLDPQCEEARVGYERLVELAAQRAARVTGTADGASPAAPRTDDFDDPHRFHATRLYHQRLDELCRAHGITLAFVHLPSFGEPELSPSHVAWRTRQAPFFRPDRRRLFDVANYQDEGHLSAAGARAFTTAVADFAIDQRLLRPSASTVARR